MLNPYESPARKAFVASMAPTLAYDEAEREYIRALCRHIWDYQFRYDEVIYQEGRASHKAIISLQQKQDPDFVLWNYYAPFAHRKAKAKNEDEIIARRIRELM